MTLEKKKLHKRTYLGHTWIGTVVLVPPKSTKEYETKKNERA